MSVPAQNPISGPFIANGITTQFAYNFLLLDASDLLVFVGGSSTTDFTVTGVGNSQGGNILFNIPPAAGLDVLIKRSTPYTRQTDYADNGDLLADVLNSDFDRLWLALQEIFANFSSSISKPVGGNWNAQGLRITTVADGVQPQDVVTVRQLTIVNGSAAQSAQEAADSAVAAALSEQSAGDSASSASDSRAAASNSASIAQKWASNPQGQEVSDGKYSAFHYAQAAASDAHNASTAATTATGAASTATTKAEEASGSAASAKTDADRAQSANPDNQLKKAQNLADLPDKAISRNNLSVYSKAEVGSKIGYALVDFGSVSTGQRKVITNPFGNGTPVITLAQVLVNEEWADAGWLYNQSGNVGIGCRAGFTDFGIVVIAGSGGLKGSATTLTGGIHAYQVAATNPASVRVHVWKLQP